MPSVKRFREERAVTARGFSRWVRPVMTRYHLECCDCGLVHEFQFRALEVTKRYADPLRWDGRLLPRSKFRVEFRCRRAPRYTAQRRKVR